MEIINIEEYPNICDKIQYELKDGTITYIDFLLKELSVLKNLKKSLTGSSVDNVSKTSMVNFDPKIMPVIDIFVKHIQNTKQNIDIKNKISLLKRK